MTIQLDPNSLGAILKEYARCRSRLEPFLTESTRRSSKSTVVHIDAYLHLNLHVVWLGLFHELFDAFGYWTGTQWSLVPYTCARSDKVTGSDVGQKSPSIKRRGKKNNKGAVINTDNKQDIDSYHGGDQYSSPPVNQSLVGSDLPGQAIWSCDLKARVRFVCPNCDHIWTSPSGSVQFRVFHHQHHDTLQTTQPYVVEFHLLPQFCKQCSTNEPVDASWYPHEVVRVLRCLHGRISRDFAHLLAQHQPSRTLQLHHHRSLYQHYHLLQQHVMLTQSTLQPPPTSQTSTSDQQLHSLLEPVTNSEAPPPSQPYGWTSSQQPPIILPTTTSTGILSSCTEVVVNTDGAPFVVKPTGGGCQDDNGVSQQHSPIYWSLLIDPTTLGYVQLAPAAASNYGCYDHQMAVSMTTNPLQHSEVASYLY